MANEPVFLTVEEAAFLKEAVGRIVSTGIRVQDSEFKLPQPDGGADGASAGNQNPCADFSDDYVE
jgi:hypothetical protein